MLLVFFQARQIYERFVVDHVNPKNWIRYAKFELRNGEPDLARKYVCRFQLCNWQLQLTALLLCFSSSVFERAVEFFGEEHMDPQLFVDFAQFEERQKEVSGRRRGRYSSIVCQYCGKIGFFIQFFSSLTV